MKFDYAINVEALEADNLKLKHYCNFFDTRVSKIKKDIVMHREQVLIIGQNGESRWIDEKYLEYVGPYEEALESFLKTDHDSMKTKLQANR